MASKEAIDVALGQAGTFGPGVLGAEASFPQAPGEPERTLCDVPEGATWPGLVLCRVHSTVQNVGRFLHVVFHPIGKMHRSRRH